MDGFANNATTDEWEHTASYHGEPTRDAIRWVFPEPLPQLTPLDCSRLLIGRGDDCDVRLLGGDISRHHCEIVRVGSTQIVRDLGSTNGVFLNGVRIRERPLSLGSVLRIGKWVGICMKARPSVTSFREVGPGLLGGPVFQPVVDLARRAAQSPLPIVLEGETGTGKELLARAIHAWSGRTGPFCAINCAALPEALAEGELFGYRKGAFTGAERASAGHFRAAMAGTLLLDEIVDMPLALQAKVLRVLEQSEVLPLGEVAPVSVDVRIIVAAQSSLQQAVAERRFRGDLLARLDGVRIRLPPLRERLEEVPWLFCRLLERHATGRAPEVEASFIEQFCLYDWPLNLRELDLLTRRLLTLYGQERVLRTCHLPACFRERPHAQNLPAHAADVPALSEAAQVKRASTRVISGVRRLRQRDLHDLEALIDALRNSRGNMTKAAASIGISRQRAYRLIEQSHEIQLEALRSELQEEPPSGPTTRRSAS